MSNPLTSKKAPAFAEQLRVLESCGIRLAHGVAPEALLVSFDRAQFEADPFRLLLCAMGGEPKAESQKGPNGYPSDNIWHFDTECIEGDGSYMKIAQRMSVLAQGDLPLIHIADRVDTDGGAAWLTFEFGGQNFKWEAAVKDDWVDASVLSRMAALPTRRQGVRRFTYIDLGGQDCLIGYASTAERELLTQHTGLKVEWLR